MKNSMSVVDVYACIKEISNVLKDARISNIYNIGKEIFVFKLKSKIRDYMLLVEPGRRIHLTQYRLELPRTPSPICMGLRKYLRGGIMVSITQLGFDRIVSLEIKRGVIYKVIAEIMPRGVLCLLGDQSKIIYTSEVKKFKDRIVKTGATYIPPPGSSLKLTELTVEEFLERIRGSPDVVRGIVRGLGLPGEFAEETCFRAGIEKTVKPPDLNLNDASKILTTMIMLLEESSKGKGYIVFRDGEAITVTPFKPTLLVESGADIVEYDSFNSALDDYFTRHPTKISGIPAEALSKEIKRLETTILKQEKLIEEYDQRAERYFKIANMLMQDLEKIKRFLMCVRKERSVLDDWVKAAQNCSTMLGVPLVKCLKEKGTVIIMVNGEEVEIDIRRKAYENISHYYELAKKNREKKKRASEVLIDLKRKMETLIREREEKKRISLIKVRKKRWYEKYHWMITSDGFLVIGGRDASQNESIVRKYLEKNDVFMHADVQGASAVVVKTGGREISEAALREAAVIAVCYSRLWSRGDSIGRVFWVRGEQVSTKPPIGQYLPKGSFIISGKREFIENVPVKLALGVKIAGNYAEIIVGPVELVKSKTKYYVVLEPGKGEPRDIAKRIKRILLKLADEEDRLYIKAVSVDELLSKIPGPSRIVEFPNECSKE